MSLYNCYHLRSDALLAMLIQLGYAADDIEMDFNGDFKKKYSSGLATIEMDERFVHLHLNENSIYDKLPEGLFHQSRGNAHNQSANSYIDEHKRFKREAKAARKFFNPLDQTFILAKADARLKKEVVLQQLMNDESLFLAKIWGLEDYKGNKYFDLFLSLLNNIDKYKAKPLEIASIIASILNCKVVFKQHYTIVKEQDQVQEEWLLGFNTCLDSENCESIIQWQFILSEIEIEQIDEFFAQKDTAQVLNLIEQFFVPIDILVGYEFEMPTLQQTDKAILGISTL